MMVPLDGCHQYIETYIMHAPKPLVRMVKPSLLLRAVNMIMLELIQLYFIMSAITAGQLVLIKCLLEFPKF